MNNSTFQAPQKCRIAANAALTTLLIGGAITAGVAPSSAATTTPQPTSSASTQAPGSNVDPAEASKIVATWRGGTPDSVARGGTLTNEVRLNFNTGASKRTVTVTANNGVFSGLPSNALSGSKISGDGKSMTLLFEQPNGTALVFQTPMVADGSKGDKASVTVTSGDTTTSTPEVPIETTEGVNAVFNYSQPDTGSISSQSSASNNSLREDLPFALTVPLASENIKDTVSFTLKLNSNNSRMLSNDIIKSFEATGATTSTPATSSKVGLPKETKIEFLGNGEYKVTMSGIPTNPVDQARKGADGKSLKLDQDSIYMVSGAFKLAGKYKTLLDDPPKDFGFTATVSGLQSSTASGTALKEGSLQDNDEKFSYYIAGEGNSYYNRSISNESVKNSEDMKIIGNWDSDNNLNVTGGNGNQWSAQATTTPGSTLFGRTAGSPLFTKGMILAIDREHQKFNGDVAVRVATQKPDDITVWYTTQNLDPNSFDPDDVSWTTTKPSDPASVTAIKATWDSSKSLDTDPDQSTVLLAGITVSDSTVTGDQLWEFGYVQLNSGRWTGPEQSSEVQRLSDKKYPSTRKKRDYAEVVGSRVSSSTSFADSAVEQGAETTVSVKSSWISKKGSTGKVDVTTTLAPGIDYVSADVAPTTVKKNSDGTTTLTWKDVSASSNVEKEFKVKVRGTGSSRATDGYFARTKVTNLSDNLSDSSSAKSATSKDDVAIKFEGATHLTKTVQQATQVAGDGTQNEWKLTVKNNDAVDQKATDVIDVLPFNGDVNGSKFSGGYSLDNVKVDGATDAMVYYTIAPKEDLSDDPSDASNGAFTEPSSIWTTSKPADSSKITGVRVVTGELKIGASYSISMFWTPDENSRPGDVFVNTAGARATNTELLMLSTAGSNIESDGSTLKVDKTMVDESPVIKGGALIRYKATVKNDSDKTAYAVSFDENPGAGLDPESVVLSNPEVGSVDGKNWKIGTLKPGQTVTVDVAAKVMVGFTGKKIVNSVSVKNPSNDPKGTCEANEGVDADNDQCDTVETPDASILKIDKKLDDPKNLTFDNGKKLVYTVTVKNAAKAEKGKATTAADVVAKDVAQQGLKDVKFSKVSTGSIAGDGTWKVGDLKAGQTETAQVTATISDGKKDIINRASVENPQNPTKDTCEANDGVDADTDQCDVVTNTPPVAKETPKPSDPADPAQPGASVKTGGEEMPIGFLAVLASALGVGAIATGVTLRRRNTKK